MRGLKGVVAVLAVEVCMLLVLGAGSALAVDVHVFSGSFGASGSTVVDPYPLSGAVGVASDPVSHDVYVVDAGAFRVQKFDSAGNFILMFGKDVNRTKVEAAAGEAEEDVCTAASGDVCQAGAQGSAGGGQFSAPAFVAVDGSGGPSAGDVYVADNGTEAVYKFTAEGGFLSANSGLATTFGQLGTMSGVAVDTAGNLWVASQSQTVFEFEQGGGFLQEWLVGATDVPVGIGVDALADVFTMRGFPVLMEHGSSGTLLREEATTFLVSPTGLAVDPVSNDVYVDVGSSVEDVSCGSVSASCPVVASFGSGQLGQGGQLGVDDGSGAVYAVDSATETVDRFSSVIAAATGPATGVGAGTATVHGTVNAEGAQLGDCRFEFGLTTEYGQSAPCVPAASSIPADSAEHPVTAELANLQGGRVYHFRLVASNARATVDGSDETFQTLPPPSFADPRADQLTASGVRLSVQINPNGYDTTYHFEWGTSTAYGTNIPVPDGDIGAGTSGVTATVHVSGLSANTTYHWRVVAQNVNGTSMTEDQTLVYDTSGPGLPDGRGYEQVTPVQKNASLIDGVGFGQPAIVSLDGSHVITSTIQCFADAVSCNASSGEAGGNGSLVSLARTSAGWQATALDPSASQFAVTGPLVSDPDTGIALLDATTLAGDVDMVARQSDGTFTVFGPATPPGSGQSGAHGILKGAISADGSRVVWETALSAFDAGSKNSATDWAFDPTDRHDYSVYEYVGAGNSQPRLVDVSGGAGSTSPVSACGARLGTLSPSTGLGAQSRDGATVYFSAIGQDDGRCFVPTALPVDTLFARLGGSRTVAISQRSPGDCGVSSGCQGSPPADAEFEGASADGSKAYFLSTQQLTDSASEDSQPGDGAVANTLRGHECSQATGPNGCNLYLYDFSRPAGHELVDVSAGDRSGAGPRVQGVVALSRDGSHVYFVAEGVLAVNLDANGQPARSGQDNLYVYDVSTGQTSFVAALPGADSNEWAEGIGFPNTANVTADGRFLVFTSSGELTPDDTSRSGARQVFRYDAQVGQLIRISIGNDGFEDNGNRSAPSACNISHGCSEDAIIVGPRIGLMDGRTDPTMSDDGGYVFFQSPLALTAHALDDVQIAVNEEGVLSYAQNVYEWHAGHVYLISDGHDTAVAPKRSCGFQSAVCLLGTDTSGQNVFFTTVDQLVPQDTDTELDFYDARVGGGFPYSVPASCSGDSCQGPAGSPPAPPTIASVTFSASGTLGGGGNAALGAGGTKVSVLGRAVHGSSFLVRVKVPGKGRIVITLAGIKTVRRAVSRAGTYTLRITLTARERQVLARKQKPRLHVAFTPPGGGSSATTVSVMEPAALRASRAGDARRATNTDRRAGK